MINYDNWKTRSPDDEFDMRAGFEPPDDDCEPEPMEDEVTETAVAQSTELVVFRDVTAVSVFGTPGGVDDVLGKIRQEVSSFKPDISTQTGRQKIASLAYKVARSKTALDDMGKDLVADLKAKTGAIDAERRRIRDELDALKDEVRKPLTDFEEAEKKRINGHEDAIREIQSFVGWPVGTSPNSDEVKSRIVALSELPPRQWQEFSGRAKEVLELALFRLNGELAAAEKREAEAAEVRRIERERIERERQEREDRIAKEAAERARLAAEAKAQQEAKEAESLAIAERRRIEREAAEAAAREAETHRREQEAAAAERKRIEDAARAKALADARELERVERAKADAESAAERERQARITEQQRAEQARIAAEQKAERDRIAAIDAERKRASDEKSAIAAETAKREADKRHRAKINNEALADIHVHGEISEDAAKSIVMAISKGLIRHVKISY